MPYHILPSNLLQQPIFSFSVSIKIPCKCTWLILWRRTSRNADESIIVKKYCSDDKWLPPPHLLLYMRSLCIRWHLFSILDFDNLNTICSVFIAHMFDDYDLRNEDVNNHCLISGLSWNSTDWHSSKYVEWFVCWFLTWILF